MKILTILFPVAMLFIAASPASETYTLNKDYKVTISGTSNLHNWDEKVETVSGTSTVVLGANGSFEINAVKMIMVVNSIKSDMKAMDKNTYKALKADADPDITLTLDEAIKAEAKPTTVSTNCKLTIAGVTKPIVMLVKISMPQKGTIDFSGSQKIKMTDYGVTPPKALFGALVTGDDITISFSTTFSQSK